MTLTRREFQVMALRAKGLTYEEVAHELGVSRSRVNLLCFAVSQRCGGGGIIHVLRALGWLRVPGESA